jgi:hypothetical protein
MGGVGGILREPKSMLIEPTRSIFYKAIILATFLLVPTRRVALRHYFSRMYRYEI